ncbi:MAG: FAD-dependent oxidoreductase [Desulfobacterales bacterium]|nr:FAD-dependent oxidoreductase [Desulfobacterales bacterium]
MKTKNILIVGGVAGGASCAARARRLSEEARIVIFERGPYVSFANCGLPYYVGKVITDESDLLVATPELFLERFNIDVRVGHNVRCIDRQARTVEVEELKTGRVYEESYDALVLSPGSQPIRPPLAGMDLPGIFTLWTIPDTRNIVDWIQTRGVKRAMVVGGGFIGLEMVENLHRLGIEVTLVEMAPHVMPSMDPEMATFIHDHLSSKGIALRLQTAVTGFSQEKGQPLGAALSTGEVIETDMVLMAVGVRPRTELAAGAGLTIGQTGGIRVDAAMRTTDEHIWAVGDAVETVDAVTGTPCLVPLAGPANRQGRIAADAILSSAEPAHTFRGVQGTAVCGILGMTAAATGLSEKTAQRLHEAGTLPPFEKIYIHPDDHAGYYPDAKTITLKLIFEKEGGRVLGAQALGLAGVEKRMDVMAAAIQHGATVFNLEEVELCYAPQYGSAKDPVNVAGMVAANLLRGHAPVVHWPETVGADVFILDVRDPDEFRAGHVPKAVNIPLNSLRDRLDELPPGREIHTHCYVGQRSYFANRILIQNGFAVKNISGGYLMYLAFKACTPGMEDT